MTTCEKGDDDWGKRKGDGRKCDRNGGNARMMPEEAPSLPNPQTLEFLSGIWVGVVSNGLYTAAILPLCYKYTTLLLLCC